MYNSKALMYVQGRMNLFGVLYDVLLINGRPNKL